MRLGIAWLVVLPLAACGAVAYVSELLKPASVKELVAKPAGNTDCPYRVDGPS